MFFMYICCMKTQLVQLRISEGLKNEMKERAKKLNMTLSAYVIYLVQKDLEKF